MIMAANKIFYFSARPRLQTNADKNDTYSSEYSYSIIDLRSFSWIWLTPSLPNSADTKFWQKLNLQQDNEILSIHKNYIFKMDTKYFTATWTKTYNFSNCICYESKLPWNLRREGPVNHWKARGHVYHVCQGLTSQRYSK